MACKRRAANVAIDTWSSWLALVGKLSTLAGWASDLFSDASGHANWSLQVGARADALVLDVQAPGLLGVPGSHLLDALVFATHSPAIRDVYVAGQHVIRQGKHPAQGFEAAMRELWGT